jgi:putative peptidoglycan lipid II flippase
VKFVPAFAAGGHGLLQAALLGLLIAGGIAIYGLLLALFGVVNWRQAVGMVRQNPVRDLRD